MYVKNLADIHIYIRTDLRSMQFQISETQERVSALKGGRNLREMLGSTNSPANMDEQLRTVTEQEVRESVGSVTSAPSQTIILSEMSEILKKLEKEADSEVYPNHFLRANFHTSDYKNYFYVVHKYIISYILNELLKFVVRVWDP